jgi:hypothetical protein
MVVHTYNPSTWEAEVESWVRGQPGLHSVFQTSLGYIKKPCTKKQKINKASNILMKSLSLP